MYEVALLASGQEVASDTLLAHKVRASERPFAPAADLRAECRRVEYREEVNHEARRTARPGPEDCGDRRGYRPRSGGDDRPLAAEGEDRRARPAGAGIRAATPL